MKFCLQAPRQIPYLVTISPHPAAFDTAKKAMLELLQHLRKKYDAKWIWRVQISPNRHKHFHVLVYNTTKKMLERTWAKLQPIAANIRISRPNKKNLSYMLRKEQETMRNRNNPTGRYWGHSNNFETQGETITIPKDKIKIVTKILKRYKPDIDQFQEGWIFGNEYTITKIKKEILEAIGPLVHDPG